MLEGLGMKGPFELGCMFKGLRLDGPRFRFIPFGGPHGAIICDE